MTWRSRTHLHQATSRWARRPHRPKRASGATPCPSQATLGPSRTHGPRYNDKIHRGRRGHRVRARVHDLRRRDAVGGLLRDAGRASRRRRAGEGVSARRDGGARIAQVGAPHARPVVRALRRDRDGSGPPQGHAAGSLRREPGRRRRGQLARRRILPGDPHHGEALGGVQSAPRHLGSRLQGAHQDPARGRPVTADLGFGMTLVALVLAVYGGAAAGVGARTGRAALVESAQHAALGVFVLITACFALLTYAFLTFDFSVRYVATNTNLATPFYYRITAVWGALEGSIILWSWMLALYTLIVILRHRHNAREFYPWVITVMLGVLAFFLLIMTIPAPPFERLTPVPADGRGLNPLLQDSGMITHPIALYLGFTGFTVPFAFAIAALVTGRVGDRWITLTRRWTIVAWYFLSLGLLIGGWWSYHVLGWGGYWAWEPVENAAFMPWLTGTAFLHSVMIQERRRMLRLWNISLVILTFGLTLFGTFLTRSGVIASVHAFTQGSIGILFLSFLALVLLTALGLVAWRWEALRSEGELDSIVSRESAFLLNNVLLVAAAFTVFFGTVFPLLSEAVRGVKVSVG